jgi:2-phosphoglycerate kinase
MSLTDGVLVLSGTPGAGKSTVSRLVATRLERPAVVNGDHVVERRQDRDILRPTRHKSTQRAESDTNRGLGRAGRRLLDTGHDQEDGFRRHSGS